MMDWPTVVVVVARLRVVSNMPHDLRMDDFPLLGQLHHGSTSKFAKDGHAKKAKASIDFMDQVCMFTRV